MPGGFLILFASQKTYENYPFNYPYLDVGGYYHTNFNLDIGGEYLALVAPDGNTAIHEYALEYPLQLTNISYGIAQYAATLVATGATASYHVPTSGDAGLGTDWTDPNFVDSGWDTGETGLGFGSAIVETGQDIGTPSAAGSYSVVDGVYTIEGDGEDIWGATDDFYYVYTPLSGDGEIIARVVSIELTNDWAKAGVMIREQLTDTSSHAMMIATPPAGGTDSYAFQWVNGTDRDNNLQSGDVTLPSWVKIVRIGDDFTGFYAPDVGGSPGAWVQAGTTTISMVEDVYIGLCVTSHSDGVLCTAVFDNVTRGGGITTDLQAQMLGINASLWTRIDFYLEEGQSELYDNLLLRMQYEDGFVAYLNGQEVASRNAPNSLDWNSTALSDRSIENSLVFEEINIMAFVDTLQTGKNVLAIHGLNDDQNNDEFLVLPELFAASNLSVPQYFTNPTPGAFNATGTEDIVSDVWFSHERGFYDTGFQLMLSTAMDSAEIRYTLDGSRPTITKGITYTAPFDVNQTTTIRAVAVKPGFLDSEVETHTYIFLDDVLTQSPNGEPPGPNWPSGSVNGQVLDYGMDPVIVNDGTWGPQLKDALTSIPTISIVTDLKNLFDPAIGIYVNAGGHGYVWERPTSLELIYPPNPQGTGFPDLVQIRDANGTIYWGMPLDMRGGFQINAGLRIRGGYSRSDGNPKHAFRLFFRREYGEGKLNYPLFGDEGVDAFDKVDLRTSQNYSWSFGGDSSNTMCREVWARDSQGLMGQGYTRSRYYHLYINGHYWGVFQTQERAEAAYASSYFGGDRDDWDCVKSTGSSGGYTIEATDGTLDAWQDLWDISNLGFENPVNYYRAQGLGLDGTRDPCYPVLLDVDNLIDYMMMVFYDGDRDAPISNFLGNTRTNNWFSVRDRTGEEGFRYAVHDAEHIMSKGMNDRTGPYQCGDLFQYSNPQWIHQELMNYPDYRLQFADHAYKYLFNDSLLTPDWAIERFQTRAEQINMAIIAESARWGDSKTDPPRTKNNWISAINYEVTNFLTGRSSVLVGLLQNTKLSSGALAPLYPGVEAPSLNPLGGWDLIGFNVTMSAPSGTIYYTTDGNDPRLPIAQSTPGSTITILAENAPKRYLVPGAPIDPPPGTILREYWTGITGQAVSDLTSSPDFPLNPSGSDQLTTFEAPTNWADDYGTRVRGYVHPPTTSNYTFWIASDDNSELWLSTNADPVNAAKIAHVPGWTDSRVWTNYPEQQSAVISLTAGQKYYIEALQKEGGGGDNLAVTWEGGGIIQGQPIAGQYLSPAPADDMWASPYLDDSSWPSGTGGVGYERNPGDPVNYVSLINLDVEGDMYGDNSSCYIRIPFTVSHTDLSDMTLKVRYDDGFIAYINGVEVARRNFTGSPQWDSAADGENPDTSAVNFENIDISAHISVLKTGDNLLAIHGLNISTSDSDFLISAELVATEISQGDISPSAIPYSGTVSLNKTTHIKARVLDGAWSALNEATYAVGPVTDYLRITEIMYHPKYTGDINDPNKEFIELKNIGPSNLNLNLVS
ncbi:MAG: FN3 associated domain-containing protein, partial [Planctomycetota bacterium]